MVADALSRKLTSMGSLVHLLIQERPLALEFQSLANKMVRLDILTNGRVLTFVQARSSVMEQIRAHQFDDIGLRVIRDKVLSGRLRKPHLIQMEF